MWSMFVVVNFPSQQQIDLWGRTASIFMFNEPLGGWRQATARDQRTKTDWAQEVAALLDTRYAACDQVTLWPSQKGASAWLTLG